MRCQEGPAGLVSKRRGKPSNRQHGAELKRTAIKHVTECYRDFGPTLAAEKLQAHHQLTVNKETLRQWMLEAGLWHGKVRRSSPTHQSRTRRPCLGELVQIDGSPHDWFEGRAPACCLLVFVDDATSRLLHLRFELSETTWGYMTATRSYIEQYGRPLCFYSDKHGIFRVNQGDEGDSQFGRALRELGIELICANSPQAKGRVERANQTLQDRLVKELRLRNISTIDEANAYLPEFIADYNRRFAKAPANPTDCHRKALPEPAVMDVIFSRHSQRKTSKNLELSYQGMLYQINTKQPSYALRKTFITVCENQQGNVTLLYHGKALPYSRFQKAKPNADIVTDKELNERVDDLIKIDGRNQGHKPAKDHPWKRYQPIVKQQQQRLTA